MINSPIGRLEGMQRYIEALQFRANRARETALFASRYPLFKMMVFVGKDDKHGYELGASVISEDVLKQDVATSLRLLKSAANDVLEIIVLCEADLERPEQEATK